MALFHWIFWPFNWAGTVSRKVFWSVTLSCFGIAFVAFWAIDHLSLAPWSKPVVLAALLFRLVSVTVRRLHDIGRTGLWALLSLIPIVSAVLVLYCGVVAGKPGQAGQWPRRKSHVIGQVALFLFLGLSFTRAFWTPYWIPAGSMKPSLLIGDYIIALPLAGSHTPKAGAIYVFRHPDSGRDFIKRLIGLPGDRVQLHEGQVVLNGTPVSAQPNGTFIEAFVRQGPWQQLPRCQNAPVSIGGNCEKSLFVETLPDGTAYNTLNVGAVRQDNTVEFTVPPGHYFFLGDNRDNSLDSRMPRAAGGLGFVPRENLLARVDSVVFSSAGGALWSFWSWRKDRFLKAVQ